MAHTASPRPQIARIWRGRVPTARADDYEQYNFAHGVTRLRDKALGVQTFREDRDDGETEFMTVSYWESVEAMSAYAGADPTRIHHLPRDPEFLVELPTRVQILRIANTHGDTGGSA